MDWCIGCKHNGKENGGFTVDVEDYYLAVSPGKLVRIKSGLLPLCLLLREMVRSKISESKWPSAAEVVVRHDRQHHGPVGFAYGGHDATGDCTGRNQ